MSLAASHTLCTICHQVTQPASPSTTICGTARPASYADGKSSATHGGFDAVPLPSWSLAFFVTDKGLWRPEEERKSFTYPAKDSAPWRVLHPRSQVCPGDRFNWPETLRVLLGADPVRCLSVGPCRTGEALSIPVPQGRSCDRSRAASRWLGRVLPGQ